MLLPLTPLDSDADPAAQAGHRWLEHTADLALELWAPDEPSLLLEGARALIDYLTEGAAAASQTKLRAHALSLEALDRGDRLVRFLEEVLYLAGVEDFITLGGNIDLRAGPKGVGLDARLQGRTASGLLVHEIKAVTYHELLVIDQCDAAGRPFVRARLILDV